MTTLNSYRYMCICSCDGISLELMNIDVTVEAGSELQAVGLCRNKLKDISGKFWDDYHLILDEVTPIADTENVAEYHRNTITIDDKKFIFVVNDGAVNVFVEKGRSKTTCGCLPGDTDVNKAFRKMKKEYRVHYISFFNDDDISFCTPEETEAGNKKAMPFYLRLWALTHSLRGIILEFIEATAKDAFHAFRSDYYHSKVMIISKYLAENIDTMLTFRWNPRLQYSLGMPMLSCLYASQKPYLNVSSLHEWRIEKINELLPAFSSELSI